MAPKPGKNGKTYSDSPLKKIREIYQFMVDQKLESLEFDHQGLHMRLVRQRPATVPVPMPVAALTVPSTAAPAAAPAAAAAGPGAALAGALTVKSPMMGIFYRASSPSSPPFVKRGDAVKRGQVLCLIEAMKVFNEIKSDFDCVIEEVLLENGKPVKAGQDLYIVSRK